jgi:predicted patatin/cPLA2 family phospholipase
MQERSLALVVEGGGLRGAFCAGVLSVLDAQLSQRVARVYAASAGAPSAAFFATGQIHRAVQIWENHTHQGELVSPLHWFKGRPLMDIDKLVAHFRREEPLAVERYAGKASEVHIAVTNCETGQAEYLRLDPHNAFEVLTATMALPLAYGRVVSVNGTPYVDGGLSDSIPFAVALASGADEVVVIQTQPITYRKRRSKFAEALFNAQLGSRYPKLLQTFQQRPERYNASVEHLTQLEHAGRVTVIRPSAPLPASRLTRDRSRILQTLEAGKAAARTWCAQNRST